MVQILRSLNKIAPASKGIIQNSVTGIGTASVLQIADSFVGSPAQRFGIVLPVLGIRISLIDLANYLIHSKGRLGVNYAKCEGADCGHVKLKNPKQTTNYKACPNCKNNNVPKNSDFCPNCGIEEESKKFEDWEDSDIEIEEEKEDE